MIVAAVNLNDETMELARLAIALLQPIIVFLLLIGLVLAMAHLLTMIGTRWGDRRASSKAMGFSAAVHILLGAGLIALIPEYRTQVFARLSEFDQDPIRIVTPPEETDLPDITGTRGSSPLFNQLPPSEQLQWDRADAPPDVASQDSALEKPTEQMRFQPERIADSPLPPEETLPVPEQELLADRGELEQARSQLTPEALPVERRQEIEIPSASEDRTLVPSLSMEEAVTPDRPSVGGIDRLSPQATPDRQAPQLSSIQDPDAVMPLDQAEQLARRDGPAPTNPEARSLGIDDPSPRNPATDGSPVDPQLSRSRVPASIPSYEEPGIGRMRPQRTPTLPDPPATRRENSIPSQDNVLPFPTERPQLARIDDRLFQRTQEDRVPSAYRLRSDQQRERAVQQFGGSEETEDAVDRSLRWLAAAQSPQGFWDASEYGAGAVSVAEIGVDRENAGQDADVGVTALAVLAFLGKQNTIDQGPYSANVNRALRWLVSQQTTRDWGEGWGRTDGYLGGKASAVEAMYCHGMATFALGEAYALSRDNPDAQWLRAPLERAVAFILDTQTSDGGWRYVKGQQEGDMSMFGWQLMALKSAEAAGIAVPEETIRRMRQFLIARQLGTVGGLAGYRLNEPPTAPMTAEALYCRQMMGMATSEPTNREATTYLLRSLPERTNLNLYYIYYGTLAMFQNGGPEWERWNIAMRDLLLSEQRQTGEFAGSWDPRGVWGGYGGRIYSTAIATLSLEVYYRYLPLYRLNEIPAELSEEIREN